ncbi:MAG: ROK family protein [Actinomycetales bacterium]|nr:ROK family protein [Actinomycetales bacterium]
MRLGIDIGGTKTAAVALDAEGSARHAVELPTELGPEAVVATVAEAAGRLAERAGTPIHGFEAIGIGVPGTVDPATGDVTHAVNLGVESLPLARLAEAALGVPVRVENDVNAAALGAAHVMRAGGGAPVASMAYLNLGTGLAAGLVIDGRVHRGATGLAGEIGHLPMVSDGELCPCGQRGCLELLASGSALARLWPGDGSAPPARALFDAADAGDPVALAVRSDFAASVAAAVRLLVLTADPELVVIGGGISALGDRLLAAVRGALLADGERSPFLAAARLPDRLRIVPRDVPVAAIGAALVGDPTAAAREEAPWPRS